MQFQLIQSSHRHSLCLFLLALLCGCSGNNQLINTPTHRLLESTKILRTSYPSALPLSRELDKGVLPAYLIEPGDTLLVQPASLDSPIRLPTDQVVPPDGRIELGRFGRIQVVGKTTDEIQSEVESIIHAEAADAGPFTVSLVGRQSKVFYVLGEVTSPGAYPLSGRETVLDAIIAAGGLTDAADTSGITYTRPSHPPDCRVVLPVCYLEIVQVGDTSTNYQVAPGDRIYVPSKTFCKQLKELIRGAPEQTCPPCDRTQCPCPDVPSMHVPPQAANVVVPMEALPLPKRMAKLSK